jgi:cysteine desulfurase
LRKHPKVRFHTDHVQGVGKVPLSFYDANIDLCTISGHKFHGVKGTGILYVREGVMLDPILSGGQQESQYRAGTENLPGIVAMAKALRMTLEKQENKIRHLNEMKQALLSFFGSMPNVILNTPNASAPHIVNVSFPGLKPEVIVHALEERDIFVSTKSAFQQFQQIVQEVIPKLYEVTR